MVDPLEPLLADGVIDEVVSRLKSGKEADLYLDLARARQALKDAKGVKEACAQAKALLPKDDKTACPPKG